jgi:hypothetical protein
MAAAGEDMHVGCRRLVIREMELENFKSYAGKQRVGPFHKASETFGRSGDVVTRTSAPKRAFSFVRSQCLQ